MVQVGWFRGLVGYPSFKF